MGSAEKELEEQLLDIGIRILAPLSPVDELLPLLDQAESFLSKVEQSPSKSMLTALEPATMGLAAKELLGHSDTDVKVAVASCISEITRITAPEAPYDDSLMKEIFEMIVDAFGKLDDISSRSFLKRVSILETVAKVRSCVVMLDLECDSLVLEMFHHFLNTIRDDHPENVFSSMEMIMTLVLEESEDISSELLSCLLMSVKKDNKDILPIARILAEKVIGNCVLKLKPYLVEAVQFMGARLDVYSEIVASICQGSLDVLEQNGVNVFSECLINSESKVSASVVSDEMPQSLQKVESEIACPGVNAAADKLSRSSASNGTVPTGNDGSLGEPTSASKKTVQSRRSMLFKNATGARLELEKLDTPLDCGTKKASGQKSNPAVQPTENTNPSQLETVESPNRREGHGREVNTLQSVGASKIEAGATIMENIQKTTEHHMTSERPSDNSASVILATDNGNLPDSSRPKRGCSSRCKDSNKKVGRSPADDVPVSRLGLRKCPVNGNSEDEAASSVDIDTTKQTEGISGSEKKLLRHSGNKGYLENLDNGGKPKSHSDTAMDVMADPEEKLHRRPGRKPQTKKANEGKASEKHRISRTKKQKDRASSEGIVGDYANQKGMLSTETPPITKANKDQNLLDDGIKRKSRKKCAREEISETPRSAIKYDESLVGVKIKVWWPDDEEFYAGVVYSYDPATLMHKVLYADGDEEVLLLKNETFKFLKGEKEVRKNVSTAEAAETPRKKAKSDSSVERSKVVSSSKSGGSAGKVSVNRSKPGRKHGLSSAESTQRRRCGSSKTDVQTATESISKEKRRRHSVDTPNCNIPSEDELDIKLKDETPRATKTKDNIGKRGRKSKSGTPKNGGGWKDDLSKIGSAKSEASTPGSKAKDDATGTGRKLKPCIASPGKSRSKPDANGASKVKSGSSKRLQTKHVLLTEGSANAGVSQESEEKGRKKRRKNSQS